MILPLVGQMLADAAHMGSLLAFFARNGIWAAAIIFPAGFFAAAGRGVTKPKRFIVLHYAGVAALTLGVISLGLA